MEELEGLSLKGIGPLIGAQSIGFLALMVWVREIEQALPECHPWRQNVFRGSPPVTEEEGEVFSSAAGSSEVSLERFGMEEKRKVGSEQRK